MLTRLELLFRFRAKLLGFRVRCMLLVLHSALQQPKGSTRNSPQGVIARAGLLPESKGTCSRMRTRGICVNALRHYLTRDGRLGMIACDTIDPPRSSVPCSNVSMYRVSTR